MSYSFKNLRAVGDPNSNGHKFSEAVEKGLSEEPKRLPSWLIFDDRGSEIFQEIIRLESYLPAVSEIEIIHTHKQTIADLIISQKALQIIDLGSGDGSKSMVLLEHLIEKNQQIHFMPIDISVGAVKNLVAALESKFKNTSLTVTGIASEYFQGLSAVSRGQSERNFVFFFGASIGNQDYVSAGKFLRKLWDSLNDGDFVMVGFDLMKSPKLLYQAYNDPGGVFQEFNLHVLDVINQQLGANFKIQNFVQEAYYNERSRAVESHIYSICDQKVRIPALDREFHFKEWEGMQTEHSYKCTMPEIEGLARNNGFQIIEHLFDAKKFYVDTIWKVKK